MGTGRSLYTWRLGCIYLPNGSAIAMPSSTGGGMRIRHVAILVTVLATAGCQETAPYRK